TNRGVIIAAYFVEHFAAKHCRPMGKRNVTGTTQQSPTIARPHFSPARINAIAKRANHRNVRTVLNNLPLAEESIRMSNVIGVHARHDWTTRVRDHGIRTARETEPFVALVKLYSLITSRPRA